MQGPIVLSVISLLSPLGIGDIGDTVIDFFNTVLGALADMLASIPKAVASIFSSWADTVSQTWYGPIIAAVTIIGFLLVIYAGFMIKNILLE